jgi:predicted amidohydrolase YtcJ
MAGFRRLGSDDELRKLAGKNTKLIDLQGRTATPGLIDTHCHFDGARLLYVLDLSTVESISEAVKLVGNKISQVQPGAWVVGEGWDEGKLEESRYITAADLDPVSAENPVWLWHTTGHYGVANSKALQLARISTETKNPPAGIIDRGQKGEPTGVLKEDPAMSLVVQLIPPLTRDQQRRGLLKMMEAFNQEGMTAAKDPGIAPDRFELYRELLTQHQLRSYLRPLFCRHNNGVRKNCTD